jgi:hypothetical protein
MRASPCVAIPALSSKLCAQFLVSKITARKPTPASFNSRRKICPRAGNSLSGSKKRVVLKKCVARQKTVRHLQSKRRRTASTQKKSWPTSTPLFRASSPSKASSPKKVVIINFQSLSCVSTTMERRRLSSVCPAPQPDRASLGCYAQMGHPQSALCNVQPMHRGHFRLLPQDPARKMARVPQYRHRQLPRRITQGIQSDLRGGAQVNSGAGV